MGGGSGQIGAGVGHEYELVMAQEDATADEVTADTAEEVQEEQTEA